MYSKDSFVNELMDPTRPEKLNGLLLKEEESQYFNNDSPKYIPLFMGMGIVILKFSLVIFLFFTNFLGESYPLFS